MRCRCTASPPSASARPPGATLVARHAYTGTPASKAAAAVRPRRCAVSGSAGGRSVVHVARLSTLPSRSRTSWVAAMAAEMRGVAASVSRSAQTPAAFSTCTTMRTRSGTSRSRSRSVSMASICRAPSGDSAVATTAVRPGQTAAARSASALSMLMRTQTRRPACFATAMALGTSSRDAALRDGCTSVVMSRQKVSALPPIAARVCAASSAGRRRMERAIALGASGAGTGSGIRS